MTIGRCIMRRRAGFTLIELLVVIIILGILAAIAVPKYLVARQRAKATEAIQQIGVIAQEIRAYDDLATAAAADLQDVGYPGAAGAVWLPTVGGNFNYDYDGTTITATHTGAGDDYEGDVELTLGTNMWGGSHEGAPQGDFN